MTARGGPPGAPAGRVAVIAVHGVADQQPGTTSRALVDLLVASPPKGVAYTAIATEALCIAVDPLAPGKRAPPLRLDATPLAEERPARKALLQSFRSDLWRESWKAPTSLSHAWHHRERVPASAPDADRGVHRTNYLLTKHRDNGAQREAYDTARIGVTRQQGNERTQIDVYEMYWADLSRLSGAVPRIIAELFTMIFRLSKLGRETVNEAQAALRVDRLPGATSRLYAGAWWVTAMLQSGLDWLFVNALALLFLQLVLLTGVLAALGAAFAVDDQVMLHRLVAIVVTVAGTGWLLYRCRDGRPSTVLWPIAVVVAGAVPLWWWPQGRPCLTALAVWVLVWRLNEAGLAVANDRFPFVRSAGRWMWFTVSGFLTLGAGKELGWPLFADSGLQLQSWMHATLFATEVVLWAIKWGWVFAGILLLIWFIAGLIAGCERGYEPKTSLATGRLGLLVSLGSFLVLAMAVWALISAVLGVAARDVAYSPCIFPISKHVAPAASAMRSNECLWTTEAAREKRPRDTALPFTPAAAYLDDRYLNSTAAFSALAVLLLTLVVYLAGMFLPSVLAEMKILVQHARDAFYRTVLLRGPKDHRRAHADEWCGIRTRRLGRWLTTGYRWLDGYVLLVALLGVVLGAVVAVLFAAPVLGFKPDSPAVAGEGVVTQAIRGLNDQVPVAINASQLFLKPLVLGAASIAAGLTLLGGVLSKYVPPLRAPLDIALDVDNYFREFPRTNIARARIFSRFAALLAHVREGGYGRIVIVAHSQGTVISAELLRFLASDGERAPAIGDRPRINGAGLPVINLLTLGCPLRQLYAARFPTLYRWILKRRRRVSGPLASDIGVERWANAFCSGDYVGRWLWSDSPKSQDVIGHPMVDRVNDRIFGRADAYAEFQPMPPQAPELAWTRELEACLGVGAHTHYFEPGQTTVAWLVDYLVNAPPVDASGGRPGQGRGLSAVAWALAAVAGFAVVSAIGPSLGSKKQRDSADRS